MSKPVTMDREYQTRDGREVRLFTVDSRVTGYPVQGEVQGDDFWLRGKWTAEGRFGLTGEHGRDLIPKPVRHKREVWVNCYPDSHPSYACVHWNREAADLHGGEQRIACLKLELEFEEGQGLT